VYTVKAYDHLLLRGKFNLSYTDDDRKLQEMIAHTVEVAKPHWTGRDMSMRESFQQNSKAIMTAAIVGGGYHQIISFELFS
jgi:hypothetical protein